MKPKHALLGVAVVVAAWLALFGDKTPNNVTEAVVRDPTAQHTTTVVPPSRQSMSAAATSALPRDHAHHAAIIIPALQPREALIGQAEIGGHATTSLFSSQTWTPAPTPAAEDPQAVNTAPPLPFTFIGKKMEDTLWEVYLLRDDHTLIAQKGTILDETYRVDAIEPPTLTLTYLPLNQMQTLTIGAAD